MRRGLDWGWLVAAIPAIATLVGLFYWAGKIDGRLSSLEQVVRDHCAQTAATSWALPDATKTP